VPAGDTVDLYEYLTTDASERLFFPIVAEDAVHGMPISNPTGIIEAIRSTL